MLKEICALFAVATVTACEPMDGDDGAPTPSDVPSVQTSDNEANDAAEKEAKASEAINGWRVEGEFRDSEFRPGQRVYFVYDQHIDGPYSTSWWAVPMKRNGDWIDLYYETNEKTVDTGIISFECSKSGAVGIVSFGNEWANSDNKTVNQIKPNEFQDWRDDNLPLERWTAVPLEFYQIAKKKFC
ncbi:hypothetical protein QQS45_13075 [Alteriqipengyuania flavescens]|uniref:hypothetical protein n=1 Tax=Alteriqipengyuania flavescens TaxID=3053610 RepID=UPI0025B59C5D|nr:hypothetical protein [Alteriqipengyuania flavescens]WJY18527.1 hypothetical protein QQW98_13070 [Alteriqipengyuania flavescens]WJY24467.1 hypothetical protein QQS45_13075 [Alteriqipengyuania flavescens]